MAIAEFDTTFTDEIPTDRPAPSTVADPPRSAPRQSTKETERIYALPNGNDSSRFFRHQYFRIIQNDNTRDYVTMSSAPQTINGHRGTQMLLGAGINRDHMKCWSSLETEKDVKRVQGRLLARYIAIIRQKEGQAAK